jgi:hypothetical protein
MYSRLIKELNEFLIQYDISADSKIFEDTLVADAGIESKKKSYEFSRYGSKDELIFSIPNLKLKDLFKLLDFFGVPQETYTVKKDISVPPDIIFNKILPCFKDHISMLAELDPSKLKPYQIDSKPKLEEKAIEKIKDLTENLLKKLNESDTVSSLEQQFSQLLFQIQGIFNVIHNKSKYYSYASSAYDELITFSHDHAEIKASIDAQELNDLFQQLAIYIKYNRAESAIAIEKIVKELDAFLLSYHINKNENDIFEHILLTLAGITNYPSACKYQRAYDKTRMEFAMIDMLKEDANIFLTWIHNNGDESATLRVSEVEESDALKSNKMRPQRYMIKKNPKYVTQYSFEVDGQALHEKILPLFKDKFVEIANQEPERLIPYQIQTDNLSSSNEKEQATKSNTMENTKQTSITANMTVTMFNPVKSEMTTVLPHEATVNNITPN